MKALFKQEALFFDGKHIEKVNAECQLTSDNIGKTLSIMANGVQMTIALEPILERLKKYDK